MTHEQHRPRSRLRKAILGGALAAALVTAGCSAASSPQTAPVKAPAKAQVKAGASVWVCRPGQAADPCAYSLALGNLLHDLAGQEAAWDSLHS